MTSWLPQHHDMGLIGSILQPLYCEMLSVMVTPAHFLMRPINWLKMISQFGAHRVGA